MNIIVSLPLPIYYKGLIATNSLSLTFDRKKGALPNFSFIYYFLLSISFNLNFQAAHVVVFLFCYKKYVELFS